MQELKREFGCETPEQAKRMLSDLTAELERTERKLEEALANFEKEWSHAVAHAAETGS
jgi:exonuclease VII small subunit